ncbi:ANTAR domain-containing protein [Spongisporangium articulatum]|uniref:ANTAR domain-containing protein n=1 Tax=Spongisporangium articulatum TaxID=3362603 RepID=A0ABW8AL09_9ACTN
MNQAASVLVGQDGGPDRRLQNLEKALTSRTVNALAVGILAGRFTLTTRDAWLVLRELSNLTNRRAADLARLLVALNDGATVAVEDAPACAALTSRLADALRRVRGDDSDPSRWSRPGRGSAER